ncbi:MAG: hypothetical protein ABMA64_42565 [Myxococcota bacterium]
MVYVVLGPLAGVQALDTAASTLIAGDFAHDLGIAVDGGLDVDGDGVQDLVVGSGPAFVVYVAGL